MRSGVQLIRNRLNPVKILESGEFLMLYNIVFTMSISLITLLMRLTLFSFCKAFFKFTIKAVGIIIKLA